MLVMCRIQAQDLYFLWSWPYSFSAKKCVMSVQKCIWRAAGKTNVIDDCKLRFWTFLQMWSNMSHILFTVQLVTFMAPAVQQVIHHHLVVNHIKFRPINRQQHFSSNLQK